MSARSEEGVLAVDGGRTVGWLLRGPQDGRVVGWLHGQPGSRKDVAAFTDDQLSRAGVRLLAIDRAGYGDTSPVGLDRRDVARDLLTVADSLGIGELPVMAVSNAALSADEQADVAMLLAGRTPELEQAYAAAASARHDAAEMIRGLAAGWHPLELALLDTPWLDAVAESVAFGLAQGHEGYLEDGLRTVRPLEFSLADVTCPVRAVHGTIDDLEPYTNLERLAARLDDCVVLALPGFGHFGPWLWPDAVLGLLTGA